MKTIMRWTSKDLSSRWRAKLQKPYCYNRNYKAWNRQQKLPFSLSFICKICKILRGNVQLHFQTWFCTCVLMLKMILKVFWGIDSWKSQNRVTWHCRATCHRRKYWFGHLQWSINDSLFYKSYGKFRQMQHQ